MTFKERKELLAMINEIKETISEMKDDTIKCREMLKGEDKDE